MQPEISIITPSYNQGRYLEENIFSVYNQGVKNLEHIVIDGGSIDNSTELLKKHSDKIAYWVSEQDNGQSDAVNKGFAKATGEVVGWLNSDDYYPEGALKKVIDAFSDPSVQVVCGNSTIFDESGKQRQGPATITEKRNKEFQLRFPDINQPATFFRRKILAEFMPLNVSLHYIMDRELWIKYIQQYGFDHIKTINETLVFFRDHAESKSGSKEIEFDNEYATVLHWLSLKNGLTEMAELLASHYNFVKGYDFTYPKYPDKETTTNMLRFFLLKRGGLVFTKEQFDFARKAYRLLHIEYYHILPEEKKALERMKGIVSSLNWAHYKMKRKLKST